MDDDAQNIGTIHQNMRHFFYVKQRTMKILANPELNSGFARNRRSRQSQRPHTAYANYFQSLSNDVGVDGMTIKA
jgi:hypothetical protein